MDLGIASWQVPDWQIYITIGVIIMSLEIVSAGFFLLPIGIAFVLTGITSLWITSLSWQLVVLAVNLSVIFLLFRRYITPKFVRDHTKTNADSMIGQEAFVVEEIRADGSQGYVKLYGDEWRALSEDAVNIGKGQKVIITALTGNKVRVKVKN